MCLHLGLGFCGSHRGSKSCEDLIDIRRSHDERRQKAQHAVESSVQYNDNGPKGNATNCRTRNNRWRRGGLPCGSGGGVLQQLEIGSGWLFRRRCALPWVF